MEKIVLNEEEISAIKDLLEEAKKIPGLECFYVAPGISLKESDEPVKVEIVMLWNNSPEYRAKLAKDFPDRDINKEAEISKKLIDEYEDIFKNIDNSIYGIVSESSELYCPFYDNFNQIFAKKMLTLGTILFDRYGSLTVAKESAEKIIPKFDDDPVIENVNQLIDGSKQAGK